MRSLFREAGWDIVSAPGVAGDAPKLWQERYSGVDLATPLTISSILHLVAIFVIPPIVTFIPGTEEPLRVMVLEHPSKDLVLILPSRPLSVQRRTPNQERPQGPEGTRLRGSGSGSGGGREGLRSAGRPRRSLPTGRAVRGEGIILQPAPELKPAKAIPPVPSIAVWTGNLPPPPTPVEPGTPNPVARPRPSASKPMMSPPAPNLEVKLIAAPELKQRTRGPILPPSASLPVALSSTPLPGAPTAPGQQLKGRPIALIAITPTAPRGGEKLIVPPNISVVGSGQVPDSSNSNAMPGLAGGALGLGDSGGTNGVAGNNGPAGTQGGTGAGLRGAGTGSGQGAAGGGGEGAGAGRGRGSGSSTGAGMGNGTAAGSGAGSSGVQGAGAGDTGSGTGLGGSGQGIGGGGILREYTIPSSSGAIRVLEVDDGSRQFIYPKDGNYDVVVLEATLPDEFPRPERFLSGRPIYTVYLNTGWGRDWILQYCEPKKPSSGGGGMVVSLGKVEKLSSPYIQTAIVPPDGMVSGDGYLLFSGKITKDGKFSEVKPAGRLAEDHLRMIQYLSRWTFRAPRRGAQPVDVEVVLVVPPKPKR